MFLMKIRSGVCWVLTAGVLVSGCAVKPAPLTLDAVKDQAAKDRSAMFHQQEAMDGPVTLEESMARAIKYNLDYRLKLMEDALSLKQLDLAHFDMLPRLVASAGYTSRDSYNASSSLSVLTNRQSLEPSTSQDRSHTSADLSFAWNVIDLGVSYFQAKQQADRFLIMNERRRKVIQNIMQQIRQAYWQAVGVQQLEHRFPPLLDEVKKALAEAGAVEQEKLRSPMEALTYRKTLLDILRQLETLRDELIQARPRLAALMNLPPGQPFTLAVPPAMLSPDLPESLEKMELRALVQRPELLEAHLQERISVNETKKAIARLFPGLEFSFGGHYDSNSFLVNKSWLEGGARFSWNLINLLSGPTQYWIADVQKDIVKMNRLTLSMAVLTQVNVANIDFLNKKRQYELSREIQDIDVRIYEQTRNAALTGAQNRLNEIRAAASALMSEYRSYQNYATLQGAYGQVMATMGVDPLPVSVESHDIKYLAETLRNKMDNLPPLAEGSPHSVNVIAESLRRNMYYMIPLDMNGRSSDRNIKAEDGQKK